MTDHVSHLGRSAGGWLTVSPTTLPAPCREILLGLGEVLEFDRDRKDEFAEALTRADAVVARSDTILDAPTLERCPRLKVIGRTGVGVELIDLHVATIRRIPVVVTPGANVAAVAEGTIAMVLALVKRLSALDALVRSGSWHARDALEIGDIEGAVFGVVGLGAIGGRVASLAHAFGATVLGTDPAPVSPPPRWIDIVSLDVVAERSDIVSLHVPGGAQTKGLIGASFFARAKRHMILVNLARGSVVDSAALVSALRDGTVAGAGLDVFEHEPPRPDDALIGIANVLLSPHKLALSARATTEMFVAAANGIAAVSRRSRPATVANPEVFS